MPLAVSAGTNLSCVVDAEGGLDCWGLASKLPGAAVLAGSYVSVAGDCALDAEGRATCWGGRYTPPGSFKQLSLNGQGCGLYLDGSVYCWPGAQIQAPDGVFDSISVWGDKGCGIEEGAVRCWGNLSESDVPPERAAGGVKQVAVSESTTCAIDQEGQVFCWGPASLQLPDELYQEIGLFGWAPQTTVFCGLKLDGRIHCQEGLWVPSESFVDLDVGENNACGITTEGKVRCWGDNSVGQSFAPGAPSCDDTVRIQHSFQAPATVGRLGPVKVCASTPSCEERCSGYAGTLLPSWIPRSENVRMRVTGSWELFPHLFRASSAHLRRVFDSEGSFVMVGRRDVDVATAVIGAQVDVDAGHILFNVLGNGAYGATVHIDAEAGLGPFYLKANHEVDLLAQSTVFGLGGFVNVPVGTHRITVEKDGIRCVPRVALPHARLNSFSVQVEADSVSAVSFTCN